MSDLTQQPWAARRSGHRLPTCATLVALLAGLVAAGGCSEDARLVEHDIPHVEVGPVTDQGLTLDLEATPQEVTYVLLRAIRDDVLAGADRQARRKALLRQLAVCDPDYIYDLYKRAMGQSAVYDRDEWIYKKVNLWAPVVAYYVDSLDLDWDTARPRLTARPTSRQEKWSGQTMQVDLAVRDPIGQPEADVVVRVRLHKHDTAGWRVFHIGFAKRRPRVAQAVQPEPAAAASQPAD